MPEAVIVATGRTPIGRANKGSLVECRPDDLAALVLKAVLAKVPQLDPSDVEDVLMGCGQPAGEAGYNVARVAALGARMSHGVGRSTCASLCAYAALADWYSRPDQPVSCRWKSSYCEVTVTASCAIASSLPSRFAPSSICWIIAGR